MADGLFVVRNRLFCLCHGPGLILENIRAAPARYHGLIGLEGIGAQIEPRMEKSLVVLAGGIEILNEAKERCAVKAAKLGFDAVPADNFLLIPSHMTVLVRVLSRRVSRP